MTVWLAYRRWHVIMGDGGQIPESRRNNEMKQSIIIGRVNFKYCGWLYFHGYQFSWIEQKSHICGVQNSWP